MQKPFKNKMRSTQEGWLDFANRKKLIRRFKKKKNHSVVLQVIFVMYVIFMPGLGESPEIKPDFFQKITENTLEVIYVVIY
jgi:hypothetical protein